MSSQLVRLNVDCNVSHAKDTAFHAAYNENFYPVIIQQTGFIECLLLKVTADSKDLDPIHYRLDITFNSEAERATWVAKDIHQEVWGKLSGTMKDFTVLHLTIN